MLKAIETRYKGYRFRSRLEARWAVFFDALGVSWEYEKEGYDLGPAGWYLPDFWLPGVYDRHCQKPGIWIEIKPEEFTQAESDRCGGLSVATGSPVFEMWGLPTEHEGVWWSMSPDPSGPEVVNGIRASGGWDNGMVWHKCDVCGTCKIEFDNDYHDCPKNPRHACTQWHPDIKRAADAARSARFEHGERGR